MPRATRRPPTGPRLALDRLEDRHAPAVFSVGTPASFNGLINNGCVATGDFDEDGDQDIVVTNTGASSAAPGQTVTVLFRDVANDKFVSPAQYTVGTNQAPGFVAVADVNNDSNLDFVVSSTDRSSGGTNSNGQLTVFLGTGLGTFSKTFTAGSGGKNAFWVGVAQVTSGDTNPDIVVGNFGFGIPEFSIDFNNFTVFTGDGTGGATGFTQGGSFTNGQTFLPTAGALGDFNGDSKLDAAFTVPGATSAGATNGFVQLFTGNGTGGFSVGNAPDSGGQYPVNLQTGDFNADGKLDLVAANIGEPQGSNFGQGSNLGVLLGDGAANFGAANALASGFGTNSAAFASAVADYNLDGKLDIAGVAYSDSSSKVSVFLGTGTGGFTNDPDSPYLTGSQSAAQYVAAADFDNNGSPDLVTVSETSLILVLDNQSAPGAATATGLTSSLNPSGLGQAVTFTATVTAGGAPVTTGSVRFLRNGVSIGPDVAVNGSGVATISTNTLPVGNSTITAQYLGASGFNASTSPAVTQVVNGAPAAATTTNLSANPTTVAAGGTVTLTAAVASAGGTPAGTVNFFDTTGGANTPIGSATLSGGVAALPPVTLSTAGTRTFSAVYAGAAGFQGSTSNPATVTVTAGSQPTTPTVGLSSSANPSTVGASVTFTAVVTGATGVPTGTVTFFDGPTALGTVGLVNGVATLPTSGLPAGQRTVTAQYGGGPGYNPATSAPLVQVVNPGSGQVVTSLALAGSANPVVVTQSVTFTATVSSPSGAPPGTVQFFADGGLLGSAAAGSNGVATFTTAALGVGSRTVTASFTPTAAGFTGSTSAPLALTVNKAGVSAQVLVGPDPTTVSRPVTIQVVLFESPDIAGAPTGSVTIRANGVDIATVELANGVAVFATSSLPVGTNAITAVYNGDDRFAAATAPPVSAAVVKATPAVAASFTLGSGGPSTLRAAVAAPDGVSVAPGGTVTFRVNGQVVGTGAVVGGQASVSATLPAGTNTITAEYAGDSAFNAASGTTTAVVPAVEPPLPPPTLPPPPPSGPDPLLVGYKEFGVGSGAGRGSDARFFNPDGTERFSLGNLFPGTGGVRTAAADFNSDGVADLVVGTGPGAVTRVRVLDGKTQQELFSVQPFEDRFQAGVYVTAGDITGDGVPDLVITPDEGGGPRVRVFSGAGFGQVADFFGIDDPAFRGGARVAVGDINGDGVGDLIVAAGFGGGPRMAGFDGTSLANGELTRKLFGDFFAFEEQLRNGAFVTAGDVDGDGFAELIAGGGPGGGPRVTAFSGSGLLGGRQQQVVNFFAGDPDNRGGVRLAAKDLDGDNKADLVVGSGTGAGSRVTGYADESLVAGGSSRRFDFDAFAGFDGGVFVG